HPKGNGIPDARAVVDSDVQVFLEQPVTYLGKRHSDFFTFVREAFFDPDLSLSVFLARLERLVIPIFERFLRQDIASGVIKQPQKKSEVGGGLSPGDKESLAKAVKKSRQSGSDRAKQNAEKRFADSKSDEFSKQEIKTMLEIKEKTDTVYWQLMDLWGVFLQTVRDTEVVLESGHRSGQNLEVSEFVRQLPNFLVNPDQLRIFSRRLIEQAKESTRPKQIELFLVVDLSGSMDAQKRRATQEAVYCLAKSLLQYQQNSRLQADDPTTEIIRLNLRVLGFGDRSEDLLLRSPNEENQGFLETEDQAEIDNRLWHSIMDIGKKSLGGTRDSESLQEVLRDLDRPDKQDQMAAKDSVAVVIEVTDGETTTASESAAIVKSIRSNPGAHACGIRIPGLLSSDTPRVPRSQEVDTAAEPEILSESGAFGIVWGEHGQQLTSIEKLKEVMISVLFAALLKQASRE
ncbi:TPA: hypothetical protein DEA21_00965, partial [Candidatus Uhrbacteria bacterium]|nr:hypothetical protein [Candidatus Uhrbacteria bacterium]